MSYTKVTVEYVDGSKEDFMNIRQFKTDNPFLLLYPLYSNDVILVASTNVKHVRLVSSEPLQRSW